MAKYCWGDVFLEGNKAKKEKENKSHAHVQAELVESLSPNHY